MHTTLSNGFLYRRLVRFLPCVFPHIGDGSLSVHSKYDIASMRDVFMSAHYWRAFDHFTSPPRLIVDLGAHCGHFSVLCHLATLERFREDLAEYVLVEALPLLIPQINRVVTAANFAPQVKIIQGLIGKKEGDASFRTDPHNLLSSKVVPQPLNRNMTVLPYRDLDSIIPSGAAIDILKIDIEGSEFDLLENYRHILLSAKLLLIEVHGTIDIQANFERKLVEVGLRPLSAPIVKEYERLLCYGPELSGYDN